MIYFTSDLHFGHDKDFILGPRGFETVEEMNQTIVENWNNLITDEDEIFVLGDLMMKDQDAGIELIKQLKGKIHVIRGNHDTDTKVQKYTYLCDNIVSIDYALVIGYGKVKLYLSHYPTLTANYDDDKPWNKHVINLFGHTHQETPFYDNNPYMYNVGLEAHNMTPISIEQILEDIKQKKEELNNENI